MPAALAAQVWRREQRVGTTGTDGEVANALVCKTSIHGFKSHSVLQNFCFVSQTPGWRSLDVLSFGNERLLLCA
jgi:hypothetical protein